jgi:hypothetical protein
MAKMTLEERKVLAEKKLKDLNDAIRVKALRDKSKEGAEKRKRENRMKYLLGSFYLSKWANGGVDKASFDCWLSGNNDRALFGFAALETTKTEG